MFYYENMFFVEIQKKILFQRPLKYTRKVFTNEILSFYRIKLILMERFGNIFNFHTKNNYSSSC